MDALAYTVTRLPATYAAAWNALGRLEERSPDFAPRSVLDLCAGPGSASWAAVETWPSIESLTQIDANAMLLQLGEKLAASAASPVLRTARRIGANLLGTDILKEGAIDSTADVAVLSYALVEFRPAEQQRVLATAWRQCTGAVVLVEPGTPQGYETILRARDFLLQTGARILAPCPHQARCPLIAPDWCHFQQRVARSRDHMILKAAEVPYEDEKFSYLIAVRENLFRPADAGRILARPQIDNRAFTAKVCKPDGSAALVSILKRDKAAFKQARKKDWGDETGPLPQNPSSGEAQAAE
jgi:ribosomal protein RSM22 (predicted rRNA methylase)